MNVVIIKTGRSETFADAKLDSPSLGDVVRTTVLLRALVSPQTSIRWLTSRAALPLLQGHPALAAVETEEPTPLSHWPAPDLLINLERAPQFLEYASTLPPERVKGYRGKMSESLQLQERENWSQGLFRLIGSVWRGEEYWLAAAAPDSECDTVGLNWKVGPKWPHKAWARENWIQLSKRIAERRKVSWQRGFDSLDEYRRWIASCSLIVTNDSLGLHLALANKKKVVALFGPSRASQVHLYGRGLAINSPEGNGVNRITVNAVQSAVERLGT